MYRDRRLKLGVGAAALVVGVQIGCTRMNGTDHAAGMNAMHVSGASATGDAPAATGMPDLTKPFKVTTNDNDSWLAPLNITRLLGRSAGGTWVAFTQKPLDDVKWPVQNARYAGNNLPTMTVQEALEALRKAGTPLAWDNGKSAMLLDYGPPSELEALRKQPPAETIGLFIRAETMPAMLQAVSDIWHIQAEADPELIRQRAAFVATRQKLENREADTPASLLAMMNYGRFGYNATQTEKYTTALEFKAVKRLDLDGLMQELARYLGGTAHHGEGNHWQFTRISDPQQLNAEIARLKGIIDQETASIMAGSTTYESRMSGQDDSDENSDNQQAAEMPQMNEEPTKAFDSLGILGAPAVPTLAGYLDTERPPLALAAVRTLDAMATAETKSALASFARKLQTPPKDKLARALLPTLQTEVIRRISREPDADTVKLLAEIALNPEAAQQVRTSARMALAATGNITPFVTSGDASETPSGEMEGEMKSEMEFVLRDQPAGSGLQPIQKDQQRGGITPLAQTKSADGQDWAVFISGRLGDPNDLWLARGQNGKWDEFLFTGHVFTRSENYGSDGSPQPGACALIVKGDSVMINPPGKNTAAELESLQKQMQDPKLPMAARRKLSIRYSQLSQNIANLLDKPITLSLADLRKDSDHDGLPDLVEARLGLDPHKADTDGDGIPDGKDMNPLAAPDRSGSDRVRLLQSIFTALYGKDEAAEPIIVILDRDQWQEFHGAHGRVLCVTPEDYQQRTKQLSALRTLQFGGPQDAASTILHKDGPCLFNDSHTRAEVHFWQWRLHAPQTGFRRYYGNMGMMTGGAQTIDYTALFERKDSDKGDWNLVSIKPSRFQTSERALATLMRAGVNGGDGN
jgi:hypothetical protein